MTLRLLLPIGLVASLGITLLLAETRWFQRIPLVERLAPYAPGRAAPTRPPFGSVTDARNLAAITRSPQKTGTDWWTVSE